MLASQTVTEQWAYPQLRQHIAEKVAFPHHTADCEPIGLTFQFISALGTSRAAIVAAWCNVMASDRIFAYDAEVHGSRCGQIIDVVASFALHVRLVFASVHMLVKAGLSDHMLARNLSR